MVERTHWPPEELGVQSPHPPNMLERGNNEKLPPREAGARRELQALLQDAIYEAGLWELHPFEHSQSFAFLWKITWMSLWLGLSVSGHPSV